MADNFLDDLKQSLGMFKEAMVESATRRAVSDANFKAQAIKIATTDELEQRQAMFDLSSQLSQQLLASGVTPQQALASASAFQPRAISSPADAFLQGQQGLAEKMGQFERQESGKKFALEQQQQLSGLEGKLNVQEPYETRASNRDFEQRRQLAEEDDKRQSARLNAQIAATAIIEGERNKLAQSKATEKSQAAITPGQKKLDQQFADTYDRWTSGGRESMDEMLTKLSSAEKTLTDSIANDTIPLTGPRIGLVPDVARSSVVRELRENVQSTSIEKLRQVLGAQFTESEGEKVKGYGYDAYVSPEENLKRVRSMKQYLASKIKSTEQKVSHFQKNQMSLKGFEEGFPRSVRRPNPQTGKLEQVTVKNSADMQEAIAEGWKE